MATPQYVPFDLDGKSYVIVPREDYDVFAKLYVEHCTEATQTETEARKKERVRCKRAGARIRALRKKHNLSQAAAAELVERDQSTWSQIEAGEREHAYLARVEGELRQALGLSRGRK